MKLTVLFVLFSITAFAQEEKKVMEPIQILFAGMEKGDSAMVHRAFHPSLTFKSVSVDASAQPVLKASTMSDFLKSIGTPHAEVYHELIWSPEVKIDGNFAQVWTPYAFYLGKAFHHCGVDAFHLFKGSDGAWKIFHLSDTRQKEGCIIPKEVSSQIK